MRLDLGVITNNQHSVFQSNVLAGVREVTAERGYGLIVDSYAEDETHPRPITLDYRAVAGVLVVANAAPIDLLHTIYNAGTPISLVSHQVPGLPVPAVITDNAQGMAELVKHVVERCHRRHLVYIRGVEGQRDNSERETAFLQARLRYNLPEPALVRGDFSSVVAAQSVRDLIEHDTPFDAIVAADYLMGIAAVETLREAGIRVPQDVSVVGFGDAADAETAGLTTVAADVVEQGRRAVRQLIGQIEGMRISGVTVLSVHLMIRQTCGCSARV